jgi:uncharacterized protein YjeT (DUF2065 family)
MDVLTLTLKLFALYLVVNGLFLVLRGKTIPLLLKDFFGHPAMVYLTGIILVFLATMYLLQYNIWNGTWKTIPTVMAWLVLVKGVGYIFFPKMLNEIAIKKSRQTYNMYGFVSVVVGLYLFFRR